jgi:hypothetical protein
MSDAGRPAADRAAEARLCLHPCRSRTAADHGHSSQGGRRPLSPQSAGHPRRHEGLPRLGRNAREIIARRGIDYVLICPGLSETTIYSAEAPNGFYKQLIAGKVPAWLQPVQLPKDWPYKMWRVVK